MRLKDYLKVEGQSFSRWWRNLLINLPPDWWIVNKSVRPALARLCGMKLGSGVLLQKGIFYGNAKNVSIGARSIICRGAFLDGFDKIMIGKSVAVAFQVTFITSTHELGPKENRVGKLGGSPIVIGDGVWVAARVVIGPGVEIGAGSMISSAAAVMNSVPANSLVAGVPGKVVTRLEDSDRADERCQAPIRPAEPPQSAVTSTPVPVGAAVQPAPAVRAPVAVASAPAPTGVEKPAGAALTRAEFHAELETLLELEKGKIQGTESLRDLPNWDSMAVLAFIALADSKLHVVASPGDLAKCRTVGDLADLFPGKIV